MVLGDRRAGNLPHIVTEIDAKTGALLARNSYNSEFGDRVAFVDCSQAQRTVTGDRAEFLGRNGRMGDPASMTRAYLSGRVGGGLDPCAAMQTMFDLAAGSGDGDRIYSGGGAEHGGGEGFGEPVSRDRRSRGGAVEGVGLLESDAGRGAGADAGRAAELSGQWVAAVSNAGVPDVGAEWVLSIGRGVWISGTSYRTRARWCTRSRGCCASMFCGAPRGNSSEGDVQHWWHPPSGRGVRTRISDDYLWLPYAVCRYVGAVGDTGVLDEKSAVSGGAGGEAGGGQLLRFAGAKRKSRRRCTSIACGRSSMGCGSGNRACR